ncbi:hypothetical protein WG66_006015 [Moniliophthora roreri]|nr:hypothetical protein WG66_006015 [Moniliophthora roreri]
MLPRKKRNPGQGIGYVDNFKGISCSVSPTYLTKEKVSEKANAIWCIHDIITLCNYLVAHVETTGDTYKFRNNVLAGATDLLNSQIIVGGFKKSSIIIAKPDCFPFKTKGWDIYNDVLKLCPDKQKDDLPPLSPPDASSPSPDAPVAWAGSVEWDESWMEHDLAASQPPTESISAPVPASTPAHSVSRKCSDDSVLHSVKQAKVTPAECISNAVMHFSGVFGDSMFKLVSQLDPSPMQHRTAMATAHEKETWLSLQNKVKLGNILKETKEADAYMSWVEASSPE